jgi:hypothetical protein
MGVQKIIKIQRLLKEITHYSNMMTAQTKIPITLMKKRSSLLFKDNLIFSMKKKEEIKEKRIKRNLFL